ncbi:MAG TPA: hypothetical protein VE075_07105 [Thermoanaerobaculia bacterium]|nr:hypothetical protein [Thermoanaerobaculia bacterium]
MTRRARDLYCEALREGGLLIVVFAALDGGFEVGKVSNWALASWILGGFTVLLVGIHWEAK